MYFKTDTILVRRGKLICVMVSQKETRMVFAQIALFCANPTFNFGG